MWAILWIIHVCACTTSRPSTIWGFHHIIPHQFADQMALINHYKCIMGVGTVGDSYLERLGLELAHNYFMGHYQIVLLFYEILGTSINMKAQLYSSTSPWPASFRWPVSFTTGLQWTEDGTHQVAMDSSSVPQDRVLPSLLAFQSSTHICPIGINIVQGTLEQVGLW